MAAIALILVAAVGGALFADFGDQDEDDEAPFVRLEASAQPQSLTISHDSGNTLQADETRVIVRTKSTQYEKYLDEFAQKPANLDRVSSGDSFTTFDGSPFSGDVEVTVVDEPSNTVLLQETLTVNPRLLVNVTDIYTNSPIFADASDLTVEYNITNDNAPKSQGVELILDGNQTAQTTHTIPQNESVNDSLTASLSGVELHNGLSLRLKASDGLYRDILEGPNFDVSIDDISIRLSAGSPVADISYTVVNTGDIGDTQDITVQSLDRNGNPLGTQSNEHTIYDEPNSSQLTVSAEPNGEVILSSNDTEVRKTVGESEYEVDITGVNGPVNETEDLIVDYKVTNTRQPDVQNITFLVDGNQIDVNESVSLKNGESISGSFSYTTDRGDPPNLTAEVVSEDDTASTDVTILAADYAVNITSAPADINETKTFTVGYEVENVGDAPGAQLIEFFIDGNNIGNSGINFVLNPNETRTDTFDYTTKPSEAGGNVTVNVTSEDNHDTEKVRVLEDPQYEVNITSVPSESPENEQFTVNYRVNNTGEQPGKQDIDFLINGTVETTDPGITLDPAEDTTGSFTYTPSTTTGVTVGVSSDNTTDTADVDVLKNPTFDVSIDDVPNEVDMGDDINVDYTVTNVGEQAGTLDVRFYADDPPDKEQEGITSPTLSPGASTTGTFTYTTNSSDPLSTPVELQTANDSETASVDVTPPNTLVASLSNESASVGDTVTVELAVLGVNSQPNIGGHELTVQWDDSVLQLDDMSNAIGAGQDNKEVPPQRTAEAKVLDFILNQNTPLDPLYTLTFTVVGTGDSDITFAGVGTDSVINDKNAQSYDTLWQNGAVEVD